MTWLRILASRIVGFVRRDRLDRDLDEELSTHLEMAIEENVSRGMSPEQARYAALRSFGGIEHVKET